MSEFFAHPTAVIDHPCAIGQGSAIWHFCHVCAGARIGRACTLGQNVYVAGGAVIGDRVKIQNNVSVYDGVTLQDEVFVGPSAVFTNVARPRSARKGERRATVVGRGATIGANATIVCGHTIGAWAFVGAGAVVAREVPARALMLGVPARIAGWVCACGERLPFDPVPRGEATCAACGARNVAVGDGVSAA